MKKILALTLTGLLVLGGAGAVVTVTAATNGEPAAQAEVSETAQNNLYLVPGTYVSGGAKVENAITSGAEKLTAEECAEIYTDNAYLCKLSAGDTLPVPTSERVDKDGTPFAFNGWWTIVEATVTYYETVPEITEATYLYADWRADLSQRKDPVEPEEGTVTLPDYYMSVKHADEEDPEIIKLLVSGTDASTAHQFDFGAPVQFYNEWFELCPGDEITVYTTGLGGSTTPIASPIENTKTRTITLEYSGDENNNTADYLEAASDNTKVTYTAATSRHFRIYIKFYDNGATMTIYMQPQE